MKIVSFKMPNDLFDRMKEARGETEQSTFMRLALEAACKRVLEPSKPRLSRPEVRARREAREVTPLPKKAK